MGAVHLFGPGLLAGTELGGAQHAGPGGAVKAARLLAGGRPVLHLKHGEEASAAAATPTDTHTDKQTGSRRMESVIQVWDDTTERGEANAIRKRKRKKN